MGSDTVFCLDKAIVAAWNKSQATVSGNVVHNIPPIGGVNLGCGTTALTTTAKDAATTGNFAGSIKFANPPTPPTTGAPPGNGHDCAAPISGVASPLEYPDGSGLGITCYTDDQGHGDIAFTRSSRGRAASDPTTLQFWADALDAVTWSTNFAGAPKSLSVGQIQKIMNCTITNWDQVGGSNKPISVWYPQTGSGTGSFFAQIFLNNVYPTTSSCLPAKHFVEENTGTQVTAAGAFFPYSFALHTAQTNGTEANVTNGFKLKAVAGTQPTATTIKEAAAKKNATAGGDACLSPVSGQFCATRYVYHTLSSGVATNVYNASVKFMGVPKSGVAAPPSICSNKYASTIRKYGFTPLPKAKTNANNTLGFVPGQSFCREF